MSHDPSGSCDTLEDDSWDVQVGVPVQFRPPLVDSDGLLDYSPGHMVFPALPTVSCLASFRLVASKV